MSEHSLSKGYVSFTSILPFSSSAPIFTIATRGFSIPTTFFMYIEPIFANCTRCDALASTLAPQSISNDAPLAVGISGASGERSTPFILPTINCPPTRIAPVLPADTKASASPCFTRFIPTTIDEFFFFLIAITGGSSNPMTSSA